MVNKNYILYNGEKLSLDDWTTMAAKATELGRSEGYIRKLVFRTKKGEGKKHIEYKHIKELNLTLVKK